MRGMGITRRSALGMMAGVAITRGAQTEQAAKVRLETAPGPFHASRASLAAYQVPDWFRDAKFGIWAHWGPQSAIEDGDWYARNMYMQGTPQNRYHVEHYGPPSRIGYKDLIPKWHASDFDPDYLVGLYKKAGAKYFVSMGVHHDNFDLWNSKYHGWNAVQMGPGKDVVGLFRNAAQKQGLKFGVTEHLWITYKWFSTSHGHDTTGPFARVPYDGADPRFASLYTDCKIVYKELPWNEDGIPESWKQQWYRRVKDLVDTYQPDLLYTDGALPFEDYGLSIVANLYNLSAKRNGGVPSAVYNSKKPEDCAGGTCVLDVERGVVNGIWPTAWQTDTSVGDWHYRRNDTYKTPKQVIDLLVDIVSRNGNLLLNFPLPNSGALDSTEMSILSEITQWMNVNDEAIYGTRPWKIFGEGPSTLPTTAAADAKFNEKNRKDLTAQDVRFTTKGPVLYAFVMGVPDREVVIPALGRQAPHALPKIDNIELLGSGKVTWTREANDLRVQLPPQKPSKYALAFKIV